MAIMRTICPFFFNPKTLQDLASELRQTYAKAQPFPHVVIDSVLPDDVADNILSEFPEPSHIKWEIHEAVQKRKLACYDETQLGDFTRHIISQLNSSVFMTFLETLTGIDGLIPDPHLVGGGPHQVERRAYLSIHADFNRHPKLKLDRRLNLLLYLNKDWEEEYGGHLELWNANMTQCEQKVLPVFNRCVIFSTTNFSYHGHPDPLTCPEGRTRKSLALYYYSNGRPPEEVSETHSTSYQRRPEEDPHLEFMLPISEPSDSSGVIQRGPQEDSPPESVLPISAPSDSSAMLPRRPGAKIAVMAKTVLKKLTPPIVIDLVRYLRTK